MDRVDEMIRHEFAPGEEPTVYTADLCAEVGQLTPALVLQRTDTAVSFEPLSLLWKLQAHPASFLWTDLGEA